jgi:integrase
VSRQREKGAGTVTERQLKGKRGRSVSLDPTTATALRAHRTAQLEERMRWGPAWVDTGRVFTHPDGGELHPDTITKRLKRLDDDAGLPSIKLHGLRHTHATLMLEAGVHIKVVQERVGHSSIAITGDVYSHVTPGLQQPGSRAGCAARGW